ncbi:MAG TPA: C39 family peptidase [Candidatus Cloacimonadota bacterium]|nr:C39 family peptidase [Candidatus Cloacimonadota bacterium]HQL15207.1 C39 family peptidase [Candidatus Cloacimonadota bacterium]
MKKIYMALLLSICFLSLIAADFPWYSQGDERWKTDQLGKTGTTIGRSGCVLSCLSMLLNAEATNPRITPDELNNWLKENGGYSGANMRWQIPGEIDGNGWGLELVAQDRKVNNWKFLSEQLQKGNKVIVKVKGRRSHWVLVTKQIGPYNKASSYLINDPGMETYKERTLAHFGGFRAARSYAGNWLDEDAFSMDSDIQVVPVERDEYLFYDLVNSPHPADVYVRIKNNLPVPIKGFFILGLFDKDNNFLRALDYEYASVDSCGYYDLLYEMNDITSIQQNQDYVNILYSKYFSNLPSLNDTIALVKNNQNDDVLNKSFLDNNSEPDELEKSIE